MLGIKQGHVRDCRDADSAGHELCAVSTMWVFSFFFFLVPLGVGVGVEDGWMDWGVWADVG